MILLLCSSADSDCVPAFAFTVFQQETYRKSIKMSKSVRNAIAAFEAHNEIVRKATPPASPARGEGGAEVGNSDSMMSPSSSLGGIDRAPFDIPFEASSRRSDIGSVASDHSATDRAALSRRNRLQQAAHGGNSSPQSVEFTPKQTVSLVERRKARQQRKEQLMNKRSSSKGSSSRRSTSGSERERESRHSPPSNPPPRSQPRQPPDPLISNRRFVHSISAESDGPEESLQSQLSPAHRAKQQRMRSTDDDDTQYNSVLTVDQTDDDATQTSVRQIMTSNQPHQFASMSRREQQQHQQQSEVMRATSSSSLETETRQVLYNQAAVSSRSSLPPRDDDDNTLDYADLNDDDNSVKYEQRRKEEERRRNETGFLDDQATPLVNKDDMEHYRRSLDTPVVKTAASIGVAATLGAILLGPVGLLVGAATVGIGVGIMQIPDEQRANMKDKAKKTLTDAQDSALNASEALSNSCATQCRNHGMANQFPSEMKQCFTHEDANNTSVDQHSTNQSTVERQRSDKVGNNSTSSGGEHFATPQEDKSEPAASGGPGRNRRVACLRKGKSQQHWSFIQKVDHSIDVCSR